MRSEKSEDATLLVLKMEEGVVQAEQCKWLLKARKGKEMNSPLQLPEGNEALPTL